MNIVEAADITEELTTIKDMALAACARNDHDFYQAYLDEDVVAILPDGVMNKHQIIASMINETASFAPKRVADTHITVLDHDTGVVTYRGVFDKPGGEIEMQATTIYHRGDSGWKGVLYQQTPIN